jgi:hypothetical protein
VNCSGARLERVRRSLDCLGITVLHSLLERRETGGRIVREGGKQDAKHLFHAAFGQFRAKALDINAR